MSSRKTLISVAVGTAFAASMGIAPLVVASENPFALQPLDKGYSVADHHEAKPRSMKEDKCGHMKMGEGKYGMAMADTNKDGKVSQEEAAKHHTSMFTMMDTNQDGFIDNDEMSKGMKGMKSMDHKKGDMK